MQVTIVGQGNWGATLLSGATANTTGTPFNIRGLNGQMTLYIEKTGGGTATLAIEVSRDPNAGTPVWYPVGYYDLGSGKADGTSGVGNASLARTVGDYTIPATNPFYEKLQLLDGGTSVRCRLTVVGAVAVSVYFDGVAA